MEVLVLLVLPETLGPLVLQEHKALLGHRVLPETEQGLVVLGQLGLRGCLDQLELQAEWE